MTEHIPENNHPVNQRAKALLKQVGESPSPNGLYAVQLLNWGINGPGNVQVDERVEADLREQAEMLWAANPERAMRALVVVSEDEERLSALDLQGSPTEAADALADSLDQLPERVPTGVSPDESVDVEAGEQEATTHDLADDLYEDFQPQRLIVPGAKPHPGKLVQSAAMAAVQPPEHLGARLNHHQNYRFPQRVVLWGPPDGLPQLRCSSYGERGDSELCQARPEHRLAAVPHSLM